MEVGFIKLYRQILDNPIIMKNGDHLAIWVYLLLKATHNGADILFNDQRYHLKPGEFSTGRKMIARELNIDESKVERVLKKFESEGQIEQVTDHKCRIIKIRKWDEFQKVNKGGTSDEQVMNTKQEGKNERISSKEDIYDFWNSKKITEHKVFTDDMKKQIQKKLATYREEDIKTAIQNYSDIYHDPTCFFKYKWTLSEFLSRQNAMVVFIHKRPEDYHSRGTNTKKIDEYQKPDARENFEFFTPEEEEKYGGVFNK